MPSMFTLALKSDTAFTFSLSVPASPIIVFVLRIVVRTPSMLTLALKSDTAFTFRTSVPASPIIVFVLRIVVRTPSIFTLALKSDTEFTLRASVPSKPRVMIFTLAFRVSDVMTLFEVSLNSVPLISVLAPVK